MILLDCTFRLLLICLLGSTLPLLTQLVEPPLGFVTFDILTWLAGSTVEIHSQIS